MAAIALFRKGLSISFFGAGQEIVELHAEAVKRHEDQVVLADGEYQVHHLLGAVVRRQRIPGCVRDHRILVQIVGRLQ